ncbi:MAG TPA: nucleoside/nucleotide kinase family protein [Marmoricola sp.]
MEDPAERVRGLLHRHERVVLGLCGPPGAGKSTLAQRVVETVGPEAVVVPLDGFHLQDEELTRLGLLHLKGAPDTFDAAGYLALLRRIRQQRDRTIYAPSFDRTREVSLAGAIPVLPTHRLIVTEGNYLLLDTPVWREVRNELTECWFLCGDDDRRRNRLVARHLQHGRDRASAEAWMSRTDEPNAVLVAATRDRADLVLDPG